MHSLLFSVILKSEANIVDVNLLFPQWAKSLWQRWHRALLASISEIEIILKWAFGNFVHGKYQSTLRINFASGWNWGCPTWGPISSYFCCCCLVFFLLSQIMFLVTDSLLWLRRPHFRQYYRSHYLHRLIHFHPRYLD